MQLTSRTLLLTAATLTAFTILLKSHLPLLFLLLVSELGAILCLIGLWLLWKETKANKFNLYAAVAGSLFVLFAIRFAITGIQLWPK